jgi:hypothetical protein
MMFKKTFLAFAVAALTAAATGIPAAATPSESQHLRGMAERTFFVQVSDLDGPFLFDNCYTFSADGTWYDLVLQGLAPGARGTWTQATNGASTAYNVVVPAHVLEDATPTDVGGDLVQNGTVTPAMGMAGLQLSATTVIPAELLGPGEPAVTVVSVGSEVDSCPLE